jgi:hypothetical protein
MANLGEAFNTLKLPKKTFQTIDYFFTQRTMIEDHEYIDKHLNRKNKKIKVTTNFLALNIPTLVTSITNSYIEKPLGFDIEIYGDEGYNYKGTITSYLGITPNFMIPIKGDKKLFININYKFISNSDEHSNQTRSQPGISSSNIQSMNQNTDNDYSNSRRFVNFIEVPKRFQNQDSYETDESLKTSEYKKTEHDTDIETL